MISKLHDDLHVIGLGDAGSLGAVKLKALGIRAEYTTIGNLQGDYEGINKIHFNSPRCELIPGNPNAMVPDISINLKLSNDIVQILQKDQHFVLFSGLGGYAGTMFSIKIAQHLLKLKKEFTIITSYPFRFEGKKRAANATLAINQLSALPNFISFNLNDLTKGRNLLLKQALETADHKMIELANTALKLGLQLPELTESEALSEGQVRRVEALKELVGEIRNW